MKTVIRRAATQSLLLVGLLTLAAPAGKTQTTQFLPEIDAYLKINSVVQLYVQAKETREGGDPTQAQFGPSLQFYLKPWLKLKNATIFDLNEEKKRALVFTVGYRILQSPNAPPIDRLRLDLTSHFPMRGGLLISDRNRADLDWKTGLMTWRYRNKLTVERRFTVHCWHPGAYVAAEVFYASQYQKWSTTALYAGTLLPIGKRVQLEPYYEHQNNTGKSPNQKLNQFGLILELYF